MILALFGLLIFGYWFWSRGTPNANFGTDKWQLGALVFGSQGGFQGVEAWRDFSAGLSGWYWHLIVSLLGIAAAIVFSRKAKGAE